MTSRTPRSDPRRDLLIALALAERPSREQVCRLGLRLEEWMDAGPEDPDETAAAAGVSPRALETALALRPGAARAAAAARERAAALGARLVTRLDADYPAELLDLELPPPALWIRGRVPLGPRIAIVGSRRMSWYGRRVARTFARELAARGVPIVSGFARGIDTAAHEAALEAAGGTTVAVLGCGLDVDYPRGSRRRAAAVAANGALVTELRPGTTPRAGFFPQRNRMIAALGASTLVVQAALRSGSLVTARLALELGRDVWAVPGEILDEGARGTNALIADGALVARGPDDLVENLEFRGLRDPAGSGPDDGGPSDPGSDATAGAGPAARIRERLRETGPSTADDLAAACELGIDEILALLLDLELDGSVRREAGPRWRV